MPRPDCLLDAVAHVTDAVGARRTTPSRLREALAGRSRIARRGFLEGLLDDADHGTCSVLEHGYLTRVERPHGLPSGQRQLVALTAAGRVVRDVAHRAQAVVIELDGRSFHAGAARRDADLERDLLAALEGAPHRPAGLGPGLRPAVRHRGARRTAAAAARLGGRPAALPHVPVSAPRDSRTSLPRGGSDVRLWPHFRNLEKSLGRSSAAAALS